MSETPDFDVLDLAISHYAANEPDLAAAAARELADLRAVVPLERFCKAYRLWLAACENAWGYDDVRVVAIRDVHLMIVKSSMLDRLVYGNETLRTEPCPKHKGRWSGLPSRPEPCGCALTGWLPARPLQGDPPSPQRSA